MQSPWAVIPARSERQAMDWSLVLASQGIQAVIERNAQDRAWQLLVDWDQHDRALQAIRQYRAENRGRPWQFEMAGTGLVFDWRSLACFAVVIGLFALGEMRYAGWRESGLMDSEAVKAGQWWRLFTATLLHEDLRHLAANVTTGVLLLGLAMGSFGSGLAVLTAYLAGVSGNLAGFLVYPQPYRGLGSSGIVMGALGLLAAESLALWRGGQAGKRLVLRGLLGGLMLFTLLGLNPASDVLAHTAGFVIGGVLGGVLTLFPNSAAHAWANRLAGFVCGSLIALTWWLAF